MFTPTQELEKRSSAITLSDMEIFVFPELMLSLVLADIMSPRIWKWRDDPWFKDIEKMNPYKRIQRLRQFIMDHYTFNLDLETWGLTTKQKEIERFRDFIDPDILRQANALFGYEGDQYYFDIGIRRHFGLDKYTSDTIPYWKTETVEAMDAFRFKAGYETGAGECVSLAALWVAALFIICRIPLEDMFMMATPLHSQNLILVKEGILTNNRRIVTKSMWTNGTALSEKARRALEHERVTIVSHISGHIHIMYDEATIDPQEYIKFRGVLSDFLHTAPDGDTLINFLRDQRKFQPCFQLRRDQQGHKCHLELEKAFAYEHSSNLSLNGPVRKKLLAEMDCDEFHSSPLPGRIIIEELEDFLITYPDCLEQEAHKKELHSLLTGAGIDAEDFTKQFRQFCIVEPRLPEVTGKRFSTMKQPLRLSMDMNREQIIEHLANIREINPLAAYAFYAYRDLTRTDSEPFLKAAIERNPVSIEGNRQISINSVAETISSFADDSIYDGPGRLAQPDEVWNYRRGDGVEKALLLANIIKSRSSMPIKINIENDQATLESASISKSFKTNKKLKAVWQL
jgi:hypothetical protein